MNAYVEKTLNSVSVPSHLLALCHSLRDDLVYCGLYEFGRYSATISVSFPVVRHGVSVEFQITNYIEQRAAELLHRGDLFERTRASPVPEVHQATDSLFCTPIPDPTLCSLKLG